jgi:hypothetical protein
MPGCERREWKRQTDFSTRMGECNTQPQIFEAIHRTLVDFRRRGVMRAFPPELQGMSVLSVGQLGRWVAASRHAFAMHAENGCGSDPDPTVLMVELLCSANNRLAQISCRETNTPANESGMLPNVGGTSNE